MTDFESFVLILNSDLLTKMKGFKKQYFWYNFTVNSTWVEWEPRREKANSLEGVCNGFLKLLQRLGKRLHVDKLCRSFSTYDYK
jgi:hypothetical protein